MLQSYKTQIKIQPYTGWPKSVYYSMWYDRPMTVLTKYKGLLGKVETRVDKEDLSKGYRNPQTKLGAYVATNLSTSPTFL